MLLLIILLGLLARNVLAIPTITTKGSKFFTSDGDQFFLKGTQFHPLCLRLDPANHPPQESPISSFQATRLLTATNAN